MRSGRRKERKWRGEQIPKEIREENFLNRRKARILRAKGPTMECPP